ncbi:MAG: translation elongation factor Ts [Oscillospiraceae bacterium]|jgi:elongation factor Ts|nr:translation elongation factor Ts [Oscillospiraceae bacterium]
MAFTAKEVQTLRERTGVGMMDCKKALTEADGDMEKAIDFLRERGLAAAAKKAGRIAAEGAVVAYQDGETAVLLEVNSETDFVAKNAEFQGFAVAVAKTVAETNPADVDTLLATALSGDSRTVQENLQDKILLIGENLKIRRFFRAEGVSATYIHAGGSVGVLVRFATDADTAAAKAEFAQLGKDIAMQVAAMNPSYLDAASVPAEVLAHEKEILIAQMKEDPKMQGKPDAVLGKIVDGKLGKYYSESCLLAQPYVKDDSQTVAQYIASVAKVLSAEVSVTEFVRFAKGEGIEKRQDDFAAEVANMTK